MFDHTRPLDHDGLQQLLIDRPGAVILNPSGQSAGWDLSTSTVIVDPAAMLPTVLELHRELRRRLARLDVEGYQVVCRVQPPRTLVVIDDTACIAGLYLPGQRKALRVMIDILFCMGPAMNIKVALPRADEWTGHHHEQRPVMAGALG